VTAANVVKPPRRIASLALAASLFVTSATTTEATFAQLTMPDAASSVPSASSGPAASSASAPAAPLAPAIAPTSTASSETPRPPPGPSVRERGSRTRRGNPASGALFLVVLVGAMGWYVIKRLRRR